MSNISYLIQFAPFAHLSIAGSQALVAGLWQGIALTFCTALFLKFLPRTTATARFTIWIAVFTASVALPLLHLLPRLQSTQIAASSHLMVDARWSYLLCSLWLGVSICRLGMLIAEAIGLRRIWLSATPIPTEVLKRADLQSTVEQARVEVCTTDEVDRPSVIGFFAPRILIPGWLSLDLSEAELRHLVLHEMEHLRRRDDWLNLLQKVGLVLFPLNPAMFWIDRRLSTEREIACDDGVLARTHAPRAYAVSLTSIAERRINLVAGRRMVALALGALGAGTLVRRRSEFATRIESILGQRTASHPALAITLLAAVLGGTVAMANAPDLVRFGPSSDGAAVASTMDRVLLPSGRLPYAPRLENASYHVPNLAPIPAEMRRQVRSARPPMKSVEALATRSALELPATTAAVSPKRPRSRENQWMVVTSWEQSSSASARPLQTAASRAETFTPGSTVPETQIGTDVLIPVTRVVIRTPDGRFFVAPYAAVPTQAGWLFVQL